MSSNETQCNLHGSRLLESALLNKGTAFTREEREKLGLDGLLPYCVTTLTEQLKRTYEAFTSFATDLEKHVYLRALQDRNEVLFYRLLMEHIAETLPIIYTPTVALACEQFSHIYRRPRGLFVSYPQRDRIRALLRNRPNREVDVIVVTDGQRILGIGDQGVGGMGIPIGKLALYSLVGGIHPSRTLPITLDVGTDNEERLKDPLYLGWAHERVSGEAYFTFIDQFVRAVKEELPGTCLQWEDFATPHARPILERYRDDLLTFNDDIQGTAAVALAAVLSASGISRTPLREQQVVFLGAGSAAVGVADYLRAEMCRQGLTEEQARRRFWLVDKDGLLHEGRNDLTPEQRVYAQPREKLTDLPRSASGRVGLAEVIDAIAASTLIGLSTVGGAFTEPIVRRMAAKVARPLILPLSNPTTSAEARPADLYRWTEGRALVATGSPFPPVTLGERRVTVSQCNNIFVFPAVGLGVTAARATRVTDGMLLAAARKLGELSAVAAGESGALLPALPELRRVAVEVAIAVGLEAQSAGIAPVTSPDALREQVVRTQWTPTYAS